MKTEDATESAADVGLILADMQRVLYERGEPTGEDFEGVLERLSLARCETLADALACLVPAFKLVGAAADTLAEAVGKNQTSANLNTAEKLILRAIKVVQDQSGIEAHTFSGELTTMNKAP